MIRRPVPILVPWIVGFLSGWLALEVFHRVEALSSGAERELLSQVHDLVATTYVDPLEDGELVDRALDGLVGSLDAYSHFYTSDEIPRLDRETSGLYRGIGVLFRAPTTEGRILFSLPGSPAHRAGLGPGDRFVEVAGLPVADMAPGELQSHLREPKSEPVAVVVEDLAGDRRTVELVPEPVVDPTVRHGRLLEGPGRIGYASVASFSKRTPGELRDEIAALQDEGASALVLDLRGNPGGVLDAAVEMANLFVEEGPLVTTRSRFETREYRAEPERAVHAGLPLAVLVDGAAASASEVLAGALQDHRVAAVVGTPTYGKGVVQTLTRFGHDRAIVKLTTSRYYTPAGRRIDRGSPDPAERGIAPDLQVPTDEAESGAVHAFLAGYSVPRDQRDALASWEAEVGEPLLDPPPADAQLAAAAALLRGEAPPGWLTTAGATAESL